MDLSETGANLGPGVRFIASSRHESHPQYSPDGRQIAFSSTRSGTSGIYLCDADGKNTVPLFVPENGWAGWPHWSPDGKHIAFDFAHEGKLNVHLIRPDGGSPVPLTTNAANEFAPSWSRDGKRVYFSSGRSGRTEVWKKLVGGDETVQVTANGGTDPVESTDGKYVYYSQSIAEAPDLRRVPVGGGAEEIVLETLWPRGFAVAESGIYFVRPPSNDDPVISIQFLDFATERVRQLTSLDVSLYNQASGIASGLAVSPDGRYVLYRRYTSNGDLMLVENFR